jgi:uncharacterized protein
MTFHEGEQAVQVRAAVQAMAQRIGRGIHAKILPVAQQFLHQQTIAVAASVDSDGRVWASALTGKPGFLTALNEDTLWIHAQPPDGDALLGNLKANPTIGLVVVEFSTRQRVRLNGTTSIHPIGWSVAVQQVYANCQKYIQVRLPQEVEPKVAEARHTDALTDAHQRWIAQADTFFIASFHPNSGADASHRGGNPGFVRILNRNTLEFPDYSGNNMFNTLGNLTTNPRSGLLFLDFANGGILQLTGQAEVMWDVDHAAIFPGAERVVEFRVEQVVEIANAMPLRFEFVQYSPFNASVPK